jgi:hypothetical protein
LQIVRKNARTQPNSPDSRPDPVVASAMVHV